MGACARVSRGRERRTGEEETYVTRPEKRKVFRDPREDGLVHPHHACVDGGLPRRLSGGAPEHVTEVGGETAHKKARHLRGIVCEIKKVLAKVLPKVKLRATGRQTFLRSTQDKVAAWYCAVRRSGMRTYEVGAQQLGCLGGVLLGVYVKMAKSRDEVDEEDVGDGVECMNVVSHFGFPGRKGCPIPAGGDELVQPAAASLIRLLLLRSGVVEKRGDVRLGIMCL